MSDEVPRSARDVRAELDAIAPMPEGDDIHAGAVSRYFAARAQQRWTLLLTPSVPQDVNRMAAMFGEIAAAYAFAALAVYVDPQECDAVARKLRDMLGGDGDFAGEWLADHLGDEAAAKINALVAELIEAQQYEAVAGTMKSLASRLRADGWSR